MPVLSPVLREETGRTGEEVSQQNKNLGISILSYCPLKTSQNIFPNLLFLYYIWEDKEKTEEKFLKKKIRTGDILVLGYCPFKTSKYLLSPLTREAKERRGEEVSQQNKNFGANQSEAIVPLRLHNIFPNLLCLFTQRGDGETREVSQKYFSLGILSL